MNKTVLLTATVQSHICQFHKPLVKMLHDNGYEVHVAARDNLDEKNGLILDFADKVFDVPFERSPIGKKNITAYSQIKRIINRGSYEYIHTNTPCAGVITRIAAKKAQKKGTKVFYTAHGFHFYNGAPKKNWLIYYPIEKYCAKLTDKLITINKEDYNFVKDKFDTDVYMIHGVGANSKKFYDMGYKKKIDMRLEHGFTPNQKIIINIGELLPNKNQAAAIEAMKTVAEKYPDSKLLIAGNGPELNNLKKAVSSAQLDKNVEFLGYTTAVDEYINIADCAVACSLREGLPVNVVESMLCGKTVVASLNRGHCSLIKDAENGYLVAPTDSAAYAEKICLALQNPQQLSEQAKKTASVYTDESVYNELRNIYFG